LGTVLGKESPGISLQISSFSYRKPSVTTKSSPANFKFGHPVPLTPSFAALGTLKTKTA
jgi:hypothetical protein